MHSGIQHLALIMDGNRRWAKKRGLPAFAGHSEGAKTLQHITRSVGKLGISYLTVYALSTENLTGRSKLELKHLFSLIEKMKDFLLDFHENQVQMRIIGDIRALPKKTQAVLEQMAEETKSYRKLTLTLAINYGGRDEIVRAIQKWHAEKPNKPLDEKSFETYLDTAGIPDVDLVVRTGGDQRLSNYLPWQTTYAELYFTPVFWPDFQETELKAALEWFETQKRNKGK